MKKLLALTLVLIVSLSVPVTVNAVLLEYTDVTAGPVLYQVDLSAPVSLSTAAVSKGNLLLGPGGSAQYDIFFDADVEDISVTYKNASNTMMTAETEKNAYTFSVSGTDTQTKSISERRGSHRITLRADEDVIITSVTFHKAKIGGIGSQSNLGIVYDDYGKAMQTAVVVSESKVALKVNGAFRYIDYENTSLSPKNIDGRLYLPIHAAARAFSVYYEDYPDLCYAYISSDNLEIYQKEDTCFIVKNGKKEDFGRFAIYLDGCAWVPFRQLAELLGETVVWRDGFAIADDRIRANNIISNDGIFTSLQNDFAQFDVNLLEKNMTYYVSQDTGLDTNNGSALAPFKTIQRAADIATAGDTVIISGGVYRETVRPKNSGTATMPVIFKAAEGEEIIISAFEKAGGFTPYKDNIYQTRIPDSIGYDRNFIIKDDEIIREGRHPNYDDSEVNAPHPHYDKENVMRATMGDIKMPTAQNITQNYTYAISDKDLNQDEMNYWKGGTFITLTGEGWTLSYAEITSSRKGKINIAHNGKGGYGITYYADKRPDEYGYITHHLNTVDMPGEWYIDDDTNTLYIIPPEGTEGETLEVEIKQRQVVVDLTDRKFVQFHNISTRGGGVTMAGDTEMDILDGGTHKYISQFDWSAAHATADIRLYDRGSRWTNYTDAPEMGEGGFYAGGKNNAYINTHIAYSAGAGIYTTGAYTYIENNFIEHASYMGTYPGAVTLERNKSDEATAPVHGGHTVVGNTLYGSGRANLYMGNGKAYNDGSDLNCPYIPCDLSFNRIEMGATTSKDTGSFYIHGNTVGNDLIKTRLHHNVVFDLGTDMTYSNMNALIYHDGWANFINTYSNVAFYTVPGYVSNAYYQHMNGDFYNFVEKWGNTDLGLVPEGMDGLTFKDYPYGKPFDAGSSLDGHGRFMLNYDRAADGSIILASEAELSGGAYLASDGFVDMPDANAKITFNGVKCGALGTELSLYYASDKYKFGKSTIPEFTVEFIKDGQVVETRREQAYAQGVNLENQSRLLIYLKPGMAGEYDIRVGVNRNYVRPAKLMFADFDYYAKATDAECPYPYDGDTILLGSWDGCSDRRCTGIVTNLKTDDAQVASKLNFSIHSTNTHKPYYLNRTFTKDATKVSMHLSTGGEYANTYVDVYIDGTRSSNLVVTFNVMDYVDYNNNAWKPVVMTEALNKTVPAGVHSVYIVYRGQTHPVNGRTFGVTDSHWISFHDGETFTNTSPKIGGQ